MKHMLPGLCVCWMVVMLGAETASSTEAQGTDSYYKAPPQFHPYPDEKGKPYTITRFGPVGIGITLLKPAFGMQVANVEKGSPAEAVGKLKAGQIIESINGQTLKEVDPRVILGGIITKAEATDGVVKFRIKEKADAAAVEVIVKIPVLGAYSPTWPLKCAKSEKIVRNMADYLVRTGSHAGPNTDLGLLFMLSTGEEKDLEVARGWVKEVVEKHKSEDVIKAFPWHMGYGGPALCEYYLRTGDASILPVIEKLADCARRTMYNSAWAGRGEVPFTYMIGGHMNAAGVHTVTFLLMAKECGVKVDEATLQASLKQFFRYAGRGNTPYGDQTPEMGFVDNGKVGGLAFEMAAAASLTPEGEKSIYAAARDISAVKGFYSTSWMLHGHTGGGIGEIWRSASMGLMADKKPSKYREFMDNRMWFYELSRRYDGSFGIVGGDRYDDPKLWGIGLALSYTMPRKTLRLTGAPATKYCKSYQLPKRPWGTEADDAFYSLVPAPDKSGKVAEVDNEKLLTDASAPLGRKVNDPKVTDEVLLQYARHPEYGVREQTATAICNLGRDSLIVELLQDKDPRARQSGAMVIHGTFKRKPLPEARLTDEMVGLLVGMINNPNESWWGVANALMGLSMAKPELIVPQVDRLVYWVKHDEWWLSTSAMFALTKVVADERCYKKVLPAIGEMVSKNTRMAGCVGRAYPMDGIIKELKGAKPEVQKLAVEVLTKAYAAFPASLTVAGGVDQQPVIDFDLKRIATELTQLPGGVAALNAVGRKSKNTGLSAGDATSDTAQTEVSMQDDEPDKAIAKPKKRSEPTRP